MTPSVLEIRVQDIDHCGIVAGIIDQMCLVEQINQILGTQLPHQQLLQRRQLLQSTGFVPSLAQFPQVFLPQNYWLSDLVSHSRSMIV